MRAAAPSTKFVVGSRQLLPSSAAGYNVPWGGGRGKRIDGRVPSSHPRRPTGFACARGCLCVGVWCGCASCEEGGHVHAKQQAAQHCVDDDDLSIRGHQQKPSNRQLAAWPARVSDGDVHSQGIHSEAVAVCLSSETRDPAPPLHPSPSIDRHMPWQGVFSSKVTEARGLFAFSRLQAVGEALLTDGYSPRKQKLCVALALRFARDGLDRESLVINTPSITTLAQAHLRKEKGGRGQQAASPEQAG